MLLLLAALQTAAPRLHVVRLERVTASPGARDHAAAARTAGGLVVLWEEAAGIDRAAEPTPPVRIWRAGLTSSGRTNPAPLISGNGNCWWPALLAAPPALIAAYEARPEHRTGDRNIVLYRPNPAWTSATVVARVTDDAPQSPLPINDATPALARRGDGSVVVAWSSGAYRAGLGYRDKDIQAATITNGTRIGPVRQLTDSTEAGHEYAPALLGLPDGRLQLLYASDSSAGRYDIYSRVVNSALVPGPPTRLTRAPGGATRPSVIMWGTTAWLSWHDLASNDVLLAALGPQGLGDRQSLRTMLQPTAFAAAGVPLAALAGASLFLDDDRLGVAFVATMRLDAARGQIQRDVWVAWLEARDGTPPVRAPSRPGR